MNRSTVLLIGTLALLAAPPGFTHGNKHAPDSQRAAPEQTDWGIAGAAKSVARTITVRMGDDMRFVPAQIKVAEGETVRFVLRNEGKLMHEYVLGTSAALEEHAALMLRFPDMEHDAPYMAHVPPGQRGEIVWRFNRVGEFEFACLIAGHYQSGMRGTLTVNPKGKQP